MLLHPQMQHNYNIWKWHHHVTSVAEWHSSFGTELCGKLGYKTIEFCKKRSKRPSRNPPPAAKLRPGKQPYTLARMFRKLELWVKNLRIMLQSKCGVAAESLPLCQLTFSQSNLFHSTAAKLNMGTCIYWHWLTWVPWRKGRLQRRDKSRSGQRPCNSGFCEL